MKRKLLFMLFAIMASIGMLQAEVLTGKCGDNLQYSLNTATGVLTITGSGEMYSYQYEKMGDYRFSSSPWGLWEYNQSAQLKSVQLPEGLTTIGDYAFYYCSLTSVTIPNSVITIGKSAFSNCSSLSSVTIGYSVTTIGEYAFNSCSSLGSITCETAIPPKVNENAFYGCPKSRYTNGYEVYLYVPFISVERYKKSWGKFYIRSLNKICMGKCGDNLKFSLNPEDLSILKITGSGAMYDYGSGNAPWYEVRSSIKSIELPAGLTTIGKTAFEGFSSLTSVTIPNSVKTIGASAFSRCTELIEINCEAITPPTIKATTFEGVSKDYAVLHVPSNNINLYRQAGGWKEFYDIRPIEANTQSGANVAVPTVTENGATVEWKYVADANTYTLEIKQNGKVIITLVFNESGQLLSINFNSGSSAPARKAPALPKFANGTTNGWQYTINGLEPNTTYTYTVTAKKDEKVLETKSIEFTTKKVTTDVENILDGSVNSTKKILHNGQIYILTPDGKKYSPTGAAL